MASLTRGMNARHPLPCLFDELELERSLGDRIMLQDTEKCSSIMMAAAWQSVIPARCLTTVVHLAGHYCIRRLYHHHHHLTRPSFALSPPSISDTSPRIIRAGIVANSNTRARIIIARTASLTQESNLLKNTCVYVPVLQHVLSLMAVAGWTRPSLMLTPDDDVFEWSIVTVVPSALVQSRRSKSTVCRTAPRNSYSSTSKMSMTITPTVQKRQ
ncbi:hypothetical protein EDD85DRAFT_539727 [Armillaria nabsnona]|nr:hypothetical protein EDD85DRAFT_539727 [Armillaria nabsnona]